MKVDSERCISIFKTQTRNELLEINCTTCCVNSGGQFQLRLSTCRPPKTDQWAKWRSRVSDKETYSTVNNDDFSFVNVKKCRPEPSLARESRRQKKGRKSKRHRRHHHSKRNSVEVVKCKVTSTKTVTVFKMRGSYQYEQVAQCGCKHNRKLENSVRH